MAKNMKALNELLSKEKGFKAIKRDYSKSGFEYNITVGKEIFTIEFRNPVEQLYDEAKSLGIKGLVEKYPVGCFSKKSSGSAELTDENDEDLLPPEEVDIVKQFQALTCFVEMLFDRANPIQSIVVSGPGGVGKTYEIFDEMEKRGVEYTLVKGYSSPRALFNTLRDHSEEVVIFDDCDSIWEDANALNILKSALETNRKGKRTVTWNLAEENEEFEFHGKIIFVSNKDFYASRSKMKHIIAVLTRVFFIQFTFDQEQMMRRIEMVSGNIEKDAAVRTAVIDYLKANAKRSKVSIRMFENLCKVYKSLGKVKFELCGTELLRAGRLG